jgi:hypothetical protein
MSIDGFDFDVNNYDRSELLEILKLSDEVNINPTEVRVAAANMLSSLSNDKNLHENEKIKVRSFLNKAVNKILFVDETISELNTNKSENEIISVNAFKGLNNQSDLQNDYEPTIDYIKQSQYKPPNIKANGATLSGKTMREFLVGNQNVTTQMGDHYLIQQPFNKQGVIQTIKKDGSIKLQHVYNPTTIVNPGGYLHTINRGLNVDSRFRDNYYSTISTDFMVTLPFKIKQCVSMQFSNLELPLTYYTFSHKLGNTNFNVIITYNDGIIVKYPCQIQEGNYGTLYDQGFNSSSTRKTLSAEINSAMQAQGIDVNKDLCFRVDTISGRSVFACPMDISGTSTSSVDTFEVQFAVDNDGNVDQNENIQLRLGWQLGFRVGTYIGGPSYTGGTGAAIVSEGIFFPRSPRYLLLAIDDYNTSSVNDYFQGAFQSSITPPNILTRLDAGPLRDAKGSFTLADSSGFVTQLNTTRTYFGPVTIEKLRITLYDEYGRVLDLNGMDWSFSLAFVCLYE